MATNSYLEFQPTTAATDVVVAKNAVSRVSFWSKAPRGKTALGKVRKAVFDDDTFPLLQRSKPDDQTFLDGSGGPVTFSVDGGTWLNSHPGDRTYRGFAKGRNMTYTVSGLAGYNLPAYVQGKVGATSHTTLTIKFPSDVIAGSMFIGAFRSGACLFGTRQSERDVDRGL